MLREQAVVNMKAALMKVPESWKMSDGFSQAKSVSELKTFQTGSRKHNSMRSFHQPPIQVHVNQNSKSNFWTNGNSNDQAS